MCRNDMSLHLQDSKNIVDCTLHGVLGLSLTDQLILEVRLQPG